MNSEPIATEMQAVIAEHPMALVCWRRFALADHECRGRITWEHAILHAGRRVNEVWAIVMLCEYAHDVGAWQDRGIMDKRINEWIAFSRIQDWEEVNRKYPRNQWQQRLIYLRMLFGHLPPALIT